MRNNPTNAHASLAIVDVPDNYLRGARCLARTIRYRPTPLIVEVESELAQNPSTLLAAAMGLITVDGSECGRFYVLRPPADRGDA